MTRLVATLALVLLAGCGGGDDDRGGSLLVATAGDSITAGALGWNPDPALREQFGTDDPQSQWQYWAQAELGDEYEFRNCGVSGDRTDAIAGRLDACIDGADLAIVQGGVNDLIQDHPPAEVAGNIRAMLERVRSTGMPVLLANVLPLNPPYRGFDPEIARLNRLLDDLGRELEVPVVDFHAVLEKPPGSGRIPARWVTDGVHPSVEGYRRLGKAVAVAVAAVPRPD